MSSIEMTREELLILLELAVEDAPAGALALRSTARWQADHDEFSRRLASCLIEALFQGGYAWAKLPKQGDDLYGSLVSATNSVSGTYRVGLTSEDANIRKMARHVIADEIIAHLRRAMTTVVRRRAR